MLAGSTSGGSGRLLDVAVPAESRLQDLERTRSVFVSSVSHEIRTPLTSILGYIELLEDEADSLTENQREMLDIIARNSNRLLELIEDILVLSQIESGSFRVLNDPVEVARFVQDACDEVRPQVDAASHQLEIQVSPDVGSVLGDPSELQRCLVQLLGNAVKFTPKGGFIHIDAARSEDGVVLTITDSGIGIAEKDLDHIFQPFFRSEEALTRAIPGTGLGLAIAMSIVELHGGQMSCSSEPDKGTTMKVVLPYAMATRFAVVDQESRG
jgi:two-component system, OmpR family, phosphate regulon sensor histidine kinase PhoR